MGKESQSYFDDAFEPLGWSARAVGNAAKVAVTPLWETTIYPCLIDHFGRGGFGRIFFEALSDATRANT